MGVVRELLRPWYLKWFYFRVWPEKQPAGFRECWRFPEAVDGAADFVFLPMADWHGPVQRTQQLALALAARGHRCVYVNPHLGREFPHPCVFSRERVALAVAHGVTELHVHLLLEPVFHHRALRASESERVARAVGSLMARGGVLVSCFPLWTGVAERLRRSHDAVVVYDCHDLLPGFGNVAEELLAAEAEAMDRADLVVFSSEPLAARRAESPHCSAIVPNGCDPEHFRLIPWRRPRARPVVGYAGALNHWFDFEAVALAAEVRPEWEFVLIGHVDTADVSRLQQMSSVLLAGPVPYTELPQRLTAFDVALIPFRLNPLTEAVNPVKLYEYLASGLPVVSANLPEVAAFGEHVYTYSAAEGMIGAIEAAFREDTPARREARRARVLRETWAARAQQLEAAVATLCTS